MNKLKFNMAKAAPLAVVTFIVDMTAGCGPMLYADRGMPPNLRNASPVYAGNAPIGTTATTGSGNSSNLGAGQNQGGGGPAPQVRPSAQSECISPACAALAQQHGSASPPVMGAAPVLPARPSDMKAAPLVVKQSITASPQVGARKALSNSTIKAPLKVTPAALGGK